MSFTTSLLHLLFQMETIINMIAYCQNSTYGECALVMRETALNMDNTCKYDAGFCLFCHR